LDSTETIEWKAFAAILDFICPLFGSGLVPLEILSSAAAVISRTLFIVYIKVCAELYYLKRLGLIIMDI
jgi:hypothetical protein